MILQLTLNDFQQKYRCSADVQNLERVQNFLQIKLKQLHMEPTCYIER